MIKINIITNYNRNEIFLGKKRRKKIRNLQIICNLEINKKSIWIKKSYGKYIAIQWKGLHD